MMDFKLYYYWRAPETKRRKRLSSWGYILSIAVRVKNDQGLGIPLVDKRRA